MGHISHLGLLEKPNKWFTKTLTDFKNYCKFPSRFFSMIYFYFHNYALMCVCAYTCVCARTCMSTCAHKSMCSWRWEDGADSLELESQAVSCLRQVLRTQLGSSGMGDWGAGRAWRTLYHWAIPPIPTFTNPVTPSIFLLSLFSHAYRCAHTNTHTYTHDSNLSENCPFILLEPTLKRTQTFCADIFEKGL